ncbi:hypothetical protein VSS86_20420, partial [Bacillus safensis]|uniref:hypothetical protein n=1 Tax=Bacillus safensis TaxID=561879 RepID=UPI002DD42336
VVMDKDVGARLDEGDSVKISVKAEGATAVHAWLVNRNKSHYTTEIVNKYYHYVEFVYNNATGEYEYTFINDADSASGKWMIDHFRLSD